MTEERPQEVLAGINRELDQNTAAHLAQLGTGTPAAQAQEQLKALLTQLVDTARRQQLTAEQNTQSTLSQASTSLAGRQRLDQIFALLNQIQQGLAGQTLSPALAQTYRSQVDQVEGQLRQQIRETDSQVTQGLQQAVAALAQAQSAMLDAQTYAQLEQLVGNLKQSLSQWQSQPPAGAPLQ
ncbi:hypothetical protein [Gelria sp. Kuro-4]|uniref:hypothetical protein n=1 Tax=Gelria sp. Kuro-4 TaxID=2796927 RepID=UPI001BF0C9C4|nr:hypothetical protein [Gelria sp. Kuro-4]BCV25419.1 hypothetical protein kuro4_21920 [Gelria sp. Kuro-4]